MDDPLPGSNEELFAEAQRMAFRSDKERSEWLDYVREALTNHPNLEAILASIEELMAVQRQQGDASMRQALVEEKLEFHAFERLARMIENPTLHREKPHSFLRGLAQVAVLGHLLPGLGKRLQEQDAQEFLSKVFADFLCKRDSGGLESNDS